MQDPDTFDGMNKYFIGVGVVIAIIIALWVINVRIAKAPTDDHVCTQDVKLCSDGSYVGRTGLNCEFTACPSEPTSLEAHIGQEASGLGVSILPTKVLEDSRCPIDVTCIQAGTVRVQARLSNGTSHVVQEFKLGQPVTTETEIITLIRVTPLAKAGVKIQNGEYSFQFKVTKR